MIFPIEPTANIDIAHLNDLVQLIFNIFCLPHCSEIQEILLAVVITHIIFSPFSVCSQHRLMIACWMIELFHFFRK